MSLYGALFGGVSGLSAQSSKIGAISDNIANSNTIGYKRSTAAFQTLVINQGNGGAYQTGGVRGSTVMNISQQGLLQATNSATDVAISGGGFFVVRSAAVAVVGDSSSTPYYTRAGSFSTDDRGNFVNTQGFFLQGWPLDREGNLPADSTNFASLGTVNVESASGVAQATSTVSLGANLKSSETVFPGSSGLLVPDSNDPANRNLAADQIIVGADYDLATNNDMRRGDTFNISIANGAQNFNFEYGGFTVGRSVASAATFGDGHVDTQSPLNLTADATVGYDTGSNDFLITIPNHGLVNGDTVTLAGLTGDTGTPGFYGNTPIAELNGSHTVTRVNANTFRITVATAHAHAQGASTDNSPITADVRSSVFSAAGRIFNADSTSANFLTGVTNTTAAALTFTIGTGSQTHTFTYINGTPNASNGEFTNMSTLADAIDAVDGLTARISGGRLVVGAEDATASLTFNNGDVAGTDVKRGLDWIKELDLQDVVARTDRFSSLQNLAAVVNLKDGVSASVTNPLSSASLTIRVDSPLQTIEFNDLGAADVIPTAGTGIDIPAATYAAGSTIPVSITVPNTFTAGDRISLSGMTLPAGSGVPVGDLLNGTFTVGVGTTGTTLVINVPVPETMTIVANDTPALGNNQYSANPESRVSKVGIANQGSVLGALGLTDSLAGVDYNTFVGSNPIPTTDIIDPRYNAAGNGGENMASGDIAAQFSRNVRIYDALGSGHDVRFSFIKTGENRWAVEGHVIPATEVVTNGTLVDGQIAVGEITFNGDGTLQTVSPALQGNIPITWVGGAAPSTITVDWGTAGALGTGAADGLSQFDAAYNVNFANQNGAPVGQLVSVSINNQGKVIASYSNGQIQALYQLPLADFANPDGLSARSGNIFQQTAESGEVNLREAGTNGTGSIVASALEQSNVDLAEELTDMIVAQRAYQANTKVIKTADDLLNELNQI